MIASLSKTLKVFYKLPRKEKKQITTFKHNFDILININSFTGETLDIVTL